MSGPCEELYNTFEQDYAAFQNARDQLSAAEEGVWLIESGIPLHCKGSIPSNDPECTGLSEQLGEARAELEAAQQASDEAAEKSGQSFLAYLTCKIKHFFED